MDERRLTLIVVPHGDLETRTFELSYTRVKVLLGIAAVVVAAFIVMASSWWYVAAQAARVPGLESDVARLEEERARVAELARTLESVEAQYERVRAALGADAAPADDELWLPPLRGDSGRGSPVAGAAARPESWPVTRPGYITRAVTGTGESNHPGVDIAVPNDSYIRAAGAGVVEEAGQNEVYGRFVLIDHGNGYESMYGHASRVFVAPGDSVERNEVIALSGSTGRSTAPHLHFEIRRNGEFVDPLTLVRRP
ncbi:MAG: M23 family metallopeptidase [Gemmatimonadota bacterium]